MTIWQMPVAEISGAFPPEVPADAIAECVDGGDLPDLLALTVDGRREKWCNSCVWRFAEVTVVGGVMYATTGPVSTQPLADQQWHVAQPEMLAEGDECDRCGAVVRDIAGEEWWQE